MSEVERYTKDADQRALAEAAVIMLEERFGKKDPNPVFDRSQPAEKAVRKQRRK
jgi:hypothetical protein